MRSLQLFWQCFSVWYVKPTGDLREADVILAHAVGEAASEPGKVNEYLAQVIRDLYAMYGLPIIAQGEVAQCIPDLPLVGRIPKQNESERYIDTVQVAFHQKEMCERNGWRRPILVSFQPHLWRAMMVSRRLGLDVRIPELKTMYDPESTQWWWRKKFIAIPREILARLYYLVTDRI